MFGYRVPAPDEAMLISGRRVGQDGTPFRVVTGHGAFAMPLFRQVSFLTLSMREAEVAEQCVTKQGIALQARAVIAFKVGNDPESIVNAAQRFLSDQDQMSVLAGTDLRRAPALDHRLDDRRGDRHRAPEARHRSARRLQGGDGQDGPDRRLAADPVDRRHGRGLHRRDGRAAQRRDPAPGEDRPGAGQPGGRRSRAGLAAQAGRVRAADRDRAGAVQGRGRQGAGRGRAVRAAGARPTPSAR